MLKVVILGSTGSLGRQTLEVLERYPQVFKIIALAANTSEALLKKQAAKFKVKNAFLSSKPKQHSPKKSTLVKLAALKEADIIVNVLSGIAGIAPSLAALRAKKILLLGNKESLFVEGKKIMKLISSLFPRYDESCRTGMQAVSQHVPVHNLSCKCHDKSPAQTASRNNPRYDRPLIIPLDSEHNAIFEILRKVYEEADAKNLPRPEIKKIILPCSGGPFYGKSAKELSKVTPAQALKHPRYQMGSKISIESATLINKGLEIIEAHHLFGLPLDKIATAYHPQCAIHGAVEFFRKDPKVAKATMAGAASATSTITYAYISTPDMREHIENALLRAARLPIPKRKITSLPPKTASNLLPPLRPGPLTGIDLVLKKFKKACLPPPAPLGASGLGASGDPTHRQANPASTLKSFLRHEEKVIRKFLQNKISFLEIFKALKHS